MTAAMLYEARQRPRPTRLVWDVECVSGWGECADAARLELLEKWREAEARLPRECRGNPKNHPEVMAALNPFTAKVVCVALYNPDTREGFVYYVAQDRSVAIVGPPGWRFVPFADERALLVEFWATLERNPDVQLCGYNSRRFDASLMFVRSFLLGVPCTMNLLPYRYSTREHLDLFDVLGGWGNVRVPSLNVVCLLAGIPTPKKAMAGNEVQAAWDRGEIAQIALYCAEDVRAEAEVAARWDATVGPVFGERRK